MGLIIGNVRLQRDMGTGISTLTDDIKFDFTCNSLHLDYFASKDTASAATVQNLVDKVTDVRVSTLNGVPESTIDGDDLYDFLPLALKIPRFATVTTDTLRIPHAFGMAYPFNPFVNEPLRPFGLPANKGIQFIQNTAADVSQDYDTYVYDMTLEGVASGDQTTGGYVKFTQDSYTSGAVNSIRDTQVVGNRLLGVYNFETTAFDDLAASVANDVIGIRQQGIAYSDNMQFTYKPSRTWSMQNILKTTASPAMVLDLGRSFEDFGILANNNVLGLNTVGKSVKIKTTSGVASEATRVYGVSLVN